MIAQFYFLLQIVAPVFVVMALGYLMRKIGILSSEADRSLTRLVVTLLAPCLALDTILGNDAFANPANWILPPVLGFASIVLGIAISRLGAKLFGIPAGGARRTFVFTTSLHNYGYIPLPLCHALFDRDTMGVLFAFYLGVELAFWSVALAQLTGHRERGSWRQALNPPIVAIPTAILLNALGAKSWIPASIETTIHLLAVCAIPLALLLSGALIADHINKESLRNGSRAIFASAAVRIGLPFNTELNRFLLVVNGTSAMKVTWGEASKTFPANELAKGVNLAAEFPDNPFSESFKAVENAVRRQQEYESLAMKSLRHSKENLAQDQAALQKLANDVVTKARDLEAAARHAVKPVKHTLKVEPVP